MFYEHDIPATAHPSCCNSDPKILLSGSPLLLKNFFSNPLYPLFFFQIITQSLDPLEASLILKRVKKRSPVIIRFHFRLRRKQKMGKIGPPLCCLSYF